MRHGFIVSVQQCSLIAWLNGLGGDQCRLTGSGSALEAITRNALCKSMFTLLTYLKKLRIHVQCNAE